MTMQKRKKMTLYMNVFFAALISLIQIMPDCCGGCEFVLEETTKYQSLCWGFQQKFILKTMLLLGLEGDMHMLMQAV